MNIAGADPGFTGAVAVFGHGPLRLNRPRLLAVYDLQLVGEGINRRIDIAHLQAFLLTQELDKAYCEYASPMRSPPNRRGVREVNANMGPYMRGAGHLEATLVCCGADLFCVMPGVWKKFFGLTGKNKLNSIDVALELCPEAREWLPQRVVMGETVNIKKYHNRAEAILMAVYGAIRQDLIGFEKI